jgi:membrane protease YdiL (CAAX protease family)
MTLERPGSGDAARATVGVVAAYGAAVVIAGLVALLTDPAAGQVRSAGSTRAQLAVQGLAFAAFALLLVEGLRLAHRPRSADPLASPSVPERRGVPIVTIIVFGVVAGVLSQLAGPLVKELLPGLHDVKRPVDGLGIGTAVGPDLGTVLVVAGVVPLGEELLFRGVLAGAWIRAGRSGLAILSSTVLFGLAHVTVGARSIVVTALLGALLATALVVSGSLGTSVLAHCSINAIALLHAGLTGGAPVTLLVAVVIATTLVAVKLSPLVSWAPPGGTLLR